jgi:hypothetical protein
MNLTIDSRKIISEIDTLNYLDKLHVLSYITKDLIRSGVHSTHQITELKGLGKEMWQNRDIDSYIQNERASWE